MISKIIISSLTFFQSAVTAQVSGTDCNAVRKFLYPDVEECRNPMTCSSDFGCVVTGTPDDCGQYRCVTAPFCPDGTTYKAFTPHISANPDKELASSSVEGYYCAKDGLECGFNDDGVFFIEAIVNNREPWNGLGTPDYRNVTMISKTKFDEGVSQGGIFKKFSTSSCRGSPVEGNNKLLFYKTTLDSDCVTEMDFDSLLSDHNGLLYIIDFYIGYDDLWDVNMFGDEGIRRGGVANRFRCIMKASDHQYIDPNPISNTELTYQEYEGEVPFKLTPFIDQNFTQEMPDTVDLSAGSYSSVDGLFVQASQEVSFSDDQQFVLHLKECTIYKHDATEVNADGTSAFSEDSSDSYVFMYNGCITTESNDFAQKATRVHWTNNTNLYAEDQFYLQFDLAGDSEYKIKYSCEMILCELDAVKDETNENGPCFLATECENRYDNLYSKRRSSFTTRSKTVEYQVAHREGELIVKGANSTRTNSTGAGKQTIISTALVLVYALFHFA